MRVPRKGAAQESLIRVSQPAPSPQWFFDSFEHEPKCANEHVHHHEEKVHRREVIDKRPMDRHACYAGAACTLQQGLLKKGYALA